MAELLTCPLDSTPLVMAADDGVFQTACHRCRREYRFTRGTLTSCHDSPAPKPGYRAVKLQIHAEHESIGIGDQVFAARWRSLKPKAAITTTEQLGPASASRLVRVHAAPAEPFEPHEAGDTAVIHAVGLAVQGGLVVTFATILAAYFYHWAFVAIFPLGALIVAGAAAWRWKQGTTRRAIEPLRLSHLSREQWLLTQLQRYRLQSADLQARMKRQGRQLDDIEKLARDMETAPGDYQHRLQVVRRGVDALRAHQANDQRLQRAIADAMQMVEIEYRASRALDYLPDDAIGRLSSTIADLDAIQAENAMLEAQLEANAEVNSLAPA